MILYNLDCNDCKQGFEAWFRDGETCDTQLAARAVDCAHCGGTDVAKAIMAPRLSRGSEAGKKTADKAVLVARQARRAMLELRRKVEENCDYVGPRFAEEARRIHYGESEERGIYGEATEAEHEALSEEGIEAHRIPWPDRSEH